MEKHLASVRVERDIVDMPGCCKNMDAQCTSQMPRSSRSRPVNTLSGGLDLYRLAGDRSLLYEPEIFPALNFKIEGVNFCCFHTGKVVITTTQIDDAVYPTLIELELYVREK